MTTSTDISPTKLDAFIGGLFPAWGAKRLQARRAYSYEAAKFTRLRGSAKQLQGPEDYTAMPDRIQLIEQMRDLEQNFGLFQAIIDKVSLYAFGTLKYQAHTGDEKIDGLYEAYLEKCFANCDLTGRHNFRQMVTIADKSETRDGDYALKWHRLANGELKLVGIEGDRIGGNVGGPYAVNYFQGITTDLDTGRPLTYRIFTRTKGNSYTNPQDIPANEILFLFDPRRIDQYRGITPFAPVINEARDLKEVLVACLIGTKFENMHGAVGYTESGQPLNDPSDLITSTDTVNNGAAMKEQSLKAGMIQWAPTGSKLDFVKSDRPSGTFQTYIDMLVRLICTALNLPYGFVYQMLGSGPAVRAELQQAQRTIQGRQQRMRERIMDPVKNTYLMDGIARGEIPFTEKWSNGGWQFPPWVTIDAGRDSNAMVKELAAGVRSKSSVFAENGEDYEDQDKVIVEETRKRLETAKALSEEFDVDFNVVLTMLGSSTPNGFLFTSASTTGVSADGGAVAPDGTAPDATDKTDSAEASTEMSARSQELDAIRRRFSRELATVKTNRSRELDALMIERNVNKPNYEILN
jgi:capsid protein